jgi:hypothetical protein
LLPLSSMNNKSAKEDENQDRFQVKIGEEIAWVEIVSIKNKIYVVEIPGQEPVFITQIKDKNNRTCWISIPQGNDDLAEIVGEFIKQKNSKTSN